MEPETEDTPLNNSQIQKLIDGNVDRSFVFPPISELFVIALVFCLILILFFPMPTFILDISIGFNLTLAILFLIIGLYARNVVELSTYPSLLILSSFLRFTLLIGFLRRVLPVPSLEKLSYLDEWAGDIVYSLFYIVDHYYISELKMSVLTFVFAVLLLLFNLVIVFGVKSIAKHRAFSIKDELHLLEATATTGHFTPDEAFHQREAFRKHIAVNKAFQGALSVFTLEFVVSIIMMILLAGFCFLSFPKLETIEILEFTPKILPKIGVLWMGVIAIQQFPLMLMTLAAGLILSRVENYKPNLPEDSRQQIANHPYSLLFTACFLNLISIGCFLGLLWEIGFVFFFFALILIGGAFAVFLEKDVKAQLTKKVEQEHKEPEATASKSE